MNSNRIVNSLMVLALALSSVAMTGGVASGTAQGPSPFVGEWQAVDADGGEMRLTIGGPPQGPFQITWTEGYFGYCDGGPGIARGEGWVNPADSNSLEGELLLVCFNSEIEPLVMNLGVTYDAATETLTALGGEGETDTVWHRPGHPPPPPEWSVIARPADDAVDGGSFPEGTPEGIVVSLLVLDDDHNNLWYGTTTTVIPEWDPGRPWVFFNPEMDLTAGNHLWVYDGVNAKELVVSALEVTGVDLGTYTVSGYAEAGSQVYVELSAGLTTVTADEDENWAAGFTSSDLGQGWSAYQLDADEDQTRVGFYIPLPSFVAYKPGAVEGYDWPMGHEITLTIGDYAAQAVSEQRPDAPEGETRVLFENLSLDTGDHVFLTDGIIGLTKDTIVTNLAVTGFDLAMGTVMGLSDPDLSLWVWLYGGDGQEPVRAGETWVATFDPLPPGSSGGATQWEDDGDGTSIDFQVPNTRLTVFLDRPTIEGYEWPDGATVTVTVAGKDACTSWAVSGYPEWDPQHTYLSINFPEGCEVAPGDEVAMSAGALTIYHTVQDVAVTEVDAETDTVAGTAGVGATVYAWIHGMDGSEMQLTADDGTWLAEFGAAGFPIDPGTCGAAEIRIGANATHWDWCVPEPPPPPPPTNAMIVGSVVANWFSVPGYSANSSLAFTIYETVDGAVLSSGPSLANDSGFAFIGPEVHNLTLLPGNYVTVTDGVVEKAVLLELITVDVFDLEQDIMAGTVLVASVGSVLIGFLLFWPYLAEFFK